MPHASSDSQVRRHESAGLESFGQSLAQPGVESENRLTFKLETSSCISMLVTPFGNILSLSRPYGDISMSVVPKSTFACSWRAPVTLWLGTKGDSSFAVDPTIDGMVSVSAENPVSWKEPAMCRPR